MSTIPENQISHNICIYYVHIYGVKYIYIYMHKLCPNRILFSHDHMLAPVGLRHNFFAAREKITSIFLFMSEMHHFSIHA